MLRQLALELRIAIIEFIDQGRAQGLKPLLLYLWNQIIIVKCFID